MTKATPEPRAHCVNLLLCSEIMVSPLYREEAREALKVRLEGELVALTPPSVKVLALGLLASLIALGVFSCITTYTKYTPSTGIIAPKEGLISVQAPISGEVVQLIAHQGDVVRAGQPLAIVRNNQAQSAGSSTYERDKANLASRKSIAKNVQEAKAAELSQALAAATMREHGAKRTLDAARQSLTSVTQTAASSKKYLSQQRELVSKGYLASGGLAAAEHAYLGDMQQVTQVEQNLAALELEHTNAEQGVLQAQRQLATFAAQKDEAIAVLDSEASRLAATAEAVVSSSSDGVVSAAPAKRGPVAAGAPLFIVAPAGPLYAHLMLSEMAMQKAKVGQQVSLEILSQSQNDSKKIQGVVETIASAPIPGSSGSEQGYLTLVRLESASKTHPLPLGSRVTARLQIETKSLMGWLFAPLMRGLRQTH